MSRQYICLQCNTGSKVCRLTIQGRSLTMGREGPGPPVFGSDYSKSKVRPLFFSDKRGQNNFGSLGPSGFKNVTSPLQFIGPVEIHDQDGYGIGL